MKKQSPAINVTLMWYQDNYSLSSFYNFCIIINDDRRSKNLYQSENYKFK